MASLTAKLSEIFQAAFAELGLPTEHARISASASGQDAQFQCNGAMPCAKIAKKSPRDVATDIINKINGNKIAEETFKDLTIGGPGFINITLQDTFIARHLQHIATDETLGIDASNKNQTIVLDYGGPNIAKSMHVGHLRSSIIGDTLRRLYKFAGYNTVGDVHMGDWGTPMGMILSELEIKKFDGEITMEMLAEIYPKAAAACKEDENRTAAAREATRKLQDGDAEYTKTWQQFIDVSITGMKKNFDALGVHFDEWKGESDAHPYIENMIADLKSRDLAEEDDGALIINISKEDDKKEVPPLILLKSDGAVLYGTTDLATIIDRVKTNEPAKIIYIVDQRQSLHFEQVFRAAQKTSIAPENKIELIHAGFGTMNGTDGKPFKTRAGGVMRLEDLITMAEEKALARLNEAELAKDMDETERTDIARKVGIAALKFADLQNNRIADYIFDIDRMTSFEGKTGPYLLYQAVRIQSLLKKAATGTSIICENYQIDNADRDLALLLNEFPSAFEGALKNNTPHILCDYAYKVAQEFSSFYGNCHILSEGNQDIRNSRLALCQQTHKTLITILNLLGISVPERM